MCHWILETRTLHLLIYTCNNCHKIFARQYTVVYTQPFLTYLLVSKYLPSFPLASYKDLSEDIRNILALITPPPLLYFKTLLITLHAPTPPPIDQDPDKSKLLVFYFFPLLPDDSQLCMWLWSTSKDANLCLTSEVEIIKSFLRPPGKTGSGGGGRGGVQRVDSSMKGNSFRSKYIRVMANDALYCLMLC